MQTFRQLGSGEGMPTEAIRAATANRTAVAPLLLEAIEKCEPNGEVEENGLFIAFHLLGQWREKPAYRTLARFLRRPGVESILGSATTETGHRVMANVFDGDPRPIHDIIQDTEADEFVRMRMFDALVILAFRNELDRTEISDFLRSRFNDLQPRDQSVVWDGWQGAIALLGLADLQPLVQEAFQNGFIDETMTTIKDFEDDLRRALAGDPLESWRRSEFEPFGDVIDELSHWACFQPKQPRDQTEEDWRPPPRPAMPAKNPFRNVGRNDPCPCSSGKKFKKCCLGKPETELRGISASNDPSDIDADELLEFDDTDIDTDMIDGPIEDYDPLIEPDPDDWLATGEQQRLDVIASYHRREGFDAERIVLHATFHAIVENQIAEGDQLPVRRILRRLMADGLDRHEAVHAIGSVLAVHINELMRQVDSPAPERQSAHDANARYFSELEHLTADAWLRSG
jgi:hypothetical protein